MWYEFCFGIAVGSGDIEVVVMQGKVSTLKHIDRHNREYIDKIKRAIETKGSGVLVSSFSTVVFISF